MFTASLIFCQKMLTSRKVLKSFTIFQFVHQYVSSGVFVSWAASDTALDHACLRLMDRPAARRPFWIPTRESPTRTEEGAARTGRGPRGVPVGAGGKQDVSAATLRTGPAGALGRGPGNRVQCLRDPRGRRGQARPRQLCEQPAGGSPSLCHVAAAWGGCPSSHPAPRRDGATAGRSVSSRAEEQVPALTQAHVRPPSLQSGPTGAPRAPGPAPGPDRPTWGVLSLPPAVRAPGSAGQRPPCHAPEGDCFRYQQSPAVAREARLPDTRGRATAGTSHPDGGAEMHTVCAGPRGTLAADGTPPGPKKAHGQEGGQTLNEVTATEEAWVEQRKKLHGESGTCGSELETGHNIRKNATAHNRRNGPISGT